MPDTEQTLRAAYRAFNNRDLASAIELMHLDVDWPNAWEGGRLVGHAAVIDYWTRQFAAIWSRVEPEGFSQELDGTITVHVHQVVRDARSGERLSDSRVRHRYRMKDGLIARMDVLESPGLPFEQAPDMLPLTLSDACSLRLLSEGDADELHALIDANRAYLGRWMPWAPNQSLSDTTAFIAGARRQLAEDNGFHAAILCEDRIIGVVGFHAVDWSHRKTSIGYWLGEQHQGNGTMTRAVRAIVDHALRTWQLHRVEVRIAPENIRSRAVVERLGFRREGTLRQAERVGGRYLDSVVYAMLSPDWDVPGR